ncbi:dihydroneopterin aldolase [Thiomicrospira sp.]|uniref:dihydroneopterin aldolase n=1 Tax=Thiomicrospira sp. TaxID=935 RepID=UPI0025D9EA38|nr:dihydroneopterin aldolase [Thiomicrospira sp.]
MSKHTQMQTDSIFIEGLKVNTIIGVHAWEKCQAQPLLFDIELFTTIISAAQTDQLADTVDYAKVSQDIIKLAQQESFELIETLAEQVCQHVLQHYSGVQAIQLKLAKPHAVAEAKQVGVKIWRQRQL